MADPSTPQDPFSASRTTRVRARPENAGTGAAPWSAPPGPEPKPRPDAGGRAYAFPAADGMLWWAVAAAGVGLLLLARVVFVLGEGNVADDAQGAAVVAALGRVALGGGLAAAALLQRQLAMGLRLALLLGAAFVAVWGLPLP